MAGTGGGQHQSTTARPAIRRNVQNRPGVRQGQVPKVIHQIWIGGKPIPAECGRWMASWKMNKGWKIIVWDDKRVDNDNLSLSPTYWTSNFGYRGDELRYAILQKYGGVYCDVDMECLKPIEPLIMNRTFVCAYEGNPHDPSRVGTAFLATAPHHPLLRHLTAGLSDSYRRHGEDAVEASGPAYLSRALKKFPAVQPLGREVLYPYWWSERQKFRKWHNLTKVFSSAYTAHHWMGTWR
jgi:mannosyltransferase OCH1-like enzyme